MDCQFLKDGSLVAHTPNFEVESGEDGGSGEHANPITLPCDASISVTMDGTNYSDCDEQFKIYSNDSQLTSVNPKCGSVSGGTEITLGFDIDEQTAQCLQDLKIGFKPKSKTISDLSSHPAVEQVS